MIREWIRPAELQRIALARANRSGDGCPSGPAARGSGLQLGQQPPALPFLAQHPGLLQGAGQQAGQLLARRHRLPRQHRQIEHPPFHRTEHLLGQGFTGQGGTLGPVAQVDPLTEVLLVQRDLQVAQAALLTALTRQALDLAVLERETGAAGANPAQS